MMEKIKVKKKYTFGAIVVGLILAIALGLGVLFLLKDEEKPSVEIKDKEPQKEKSVKIVDLTSNKRPIAVMINTHNAALPQVGLNSAFIVYELMVEGGITRMMALYEQDFNETKIGSIRSSRHNYLDYAMENDAIYVHWGGSVPAYNDLDKLNIDHLDGMVYGGKYFTTDKTLNRSLEHTRFSSSDMIREGIEKLKLRTTTDNGYLLNYTADIVDLSSKEGSSVANNVAIKYSSYRTAEYEYNSEEQVYYRSMNGKKHTDLLTGEQYHFKNIIAYAVQYDSYQGEKWRDLKNIGTGEGVYITNGYSIPIIWTKESRESKTKYTYLDGTEIDVSDGNTFIQIYPTDGSITIE